MEADEIRSKKSKVLRRSERLTIRDLGLNPDIIILSADKCNTTVVLDSSNYNFKIQELFKDCANSFLANHPTNRIQWEITSFIKSSLIPIKSWLRYVYDTVFGWPHGKENLQIFLNHLNSHRSYTTFTMELESASTFILCFSFSSTKW